MPDERGMPASPEAERAILGAVLLDNSITSSLTELTEGDFAVDSHRRIFKRMGELYISKAPIDLITLTDTLNAYRELEGVGGVAYIASLTNGLVRRTSVAHYVQILREKSLLRRMVHLGNLLSTKAMESDSSVAELLQMSQGQLLTMALESSAGDKDLFVDAADFCSGHIQETDWLVEGLIEVGSNGIAAADPKGAKSLTFAAYLATCLALGVPWLGLRIKKRTRTAVVSREDNPATTKRRIKQVTVGLEAHVEELRGWLHVNSKEQTPSLMLDNPREVNSLIRSLQKWQSEFVILDVFNKLHTQDENDNTKVRAVMNQIDRIQAETGAQVCVLHHWNKGDASQSVTRRIRGAGAIAGFAEWICGIEMIDEAQEVRRMSFETKVGAHVKPISYQVVDNRSNGGIEFHLLDAVTEPPKGRAAREGR